MKEEDILVNTTRYEQKKNQIPKDLKWIRIVSGPQKTPLMPGSPGWFCPWYILVEYTSEAH